MFCGDVYMSARIGLNVLFMALEAVGRLTKNQI